MYAAIGAVLLVFYLVNRSHFLIHVKSSIDEHFPRLYTALSPLSLIARLIPKIPIRRGLRFVWDERDTVYRDANLKTFVIAPLLLGRPLICTSSLPVFQQILALNSPFQKPLFATQVPEAMGKNLVSAVGDVWKRHRRITAPAFNHTTYRNVWETTVKVYEDMLKHEGWLHADKTAPTDFNKITHKLALFLIAIVAFNIPMTWLEPPRDEKGQLSVQRMVFQTARNMQLRFFLPRWFYFLGIKKLKDIEEAYTALDGFIRERIVEREVQLKKVRSMEGPNDADMSESIKDVFGRLVNARVSDGKLTLSDEEIVGNCFIFAFAGHETTANTTVVTLALLALHPEKQEWVYNSIEFAIGDRDPAFEDYDDLNVVLACFTEALRLYPAGYVLIREAIRDCTLSIPRRDNPKIIEQVFIKKGTPFCLDFVGMFYDPQTYPEPKSFKPERWLVGSGKGALQSSSITKDTDAGEVSGSSPATSLEGFAGFSLGPRTCLGHKFAKVEAVAFLTLLLREWHVEPVLNEGETMEAWKERVLKPSFGVTLTVDDVPLKLIRRK